MTFTHCKTKEICNWQSFANTQKKLMKKKSGWTDRPRGWTGLLYNVIHLTNNFIFGVLRGELFAALMFRGNCWSHPALHELLYQFLSENVMHSSDHFVAEITSTFWRIFCKGNPFRELAMNSKSGHVLSLEPATTSVHFLSRLHERKCN